MNHKNVCCTCIKTNKYCHYTSSRITEIQFSVSHNVCCHYILSYIMINKYCHYILSYIMINKYYHYILSYIMIIFIYHYIREYIMTTNIPMYNINRHTSYLI